MAKETETKVLDVDGDAIKQKMQDLGAEKILEVRYIVDWYRLKGIKEGEDPWYLRIRKRSDGVSEVTWKGKSQKLGVSRTHTEIHFETSDPHKLADLFEQIGLEAYAHQERDRVSWKYKDWRFDLDFFPNMPPYLEIEGDSETHIAEALRLLGLEHHKTSADGERVVAQSYGLNWYDMRFSHD